MQNHAKMMVALAAALLAVGGCAKNENGNGYGNGGAQQAAAQSLAVAGPENHGHTPQTGPRRTVKSGSGLRFFHRMATPVRSGSGHQVEILIGHDYPGQNLSLSANADEGLELAVSRTALLLPTGKNANWTIPFRTRGDGVYYINVTGTVNRPGGGQDSGVFSVRVEVGEQRAKPKTAVDAVTLPADEKIY